MAEMTAKLLESECKCAYVNRPTTNGSMTICNMDHVACLLSQLEDYVESEGSSYGFAGCPPACFELSYSMSLSSSQLLDRSRLTNTTGLSLNDLAVVHVFVPARTIRTQVIRESVPFTDFLCE